MLSHELLFRAAAALLLLGTFGHTFGGMLGTAKKGPGAGPAADQVMAEMKRVTFEWNGAKGSSWYGFWLGNGLCVSALLVLAVVVLWQLGGVDPNASRAWLPVAVTNVLSLAGVSALSFRYFGPRVAVVFLLIAGLAGAGTVALF